MPSATQVACGSRPRRGELFDVGDGQTLASDDIVDQPCRGGQPVRLGEDLEAVRRSGTSAKWCQDSAAASSRKGRRTPGRTRHRSGGGQVQRSPSRGCRLVRPRRRRRSTGRSRCGRSAPGGSDGRTAHSTSGLGRKSLPPRGSRGATSRTAAVPSRSGSCASRSPPTRQRCRRGPPGLRRRSRPGGVSTAKPTSCRCCNKRLDGRGPPASRPTDRVPHAHDRAMPVALELFLRIRWHQLCLTARTMASGVR